MLLIGCIRQQRYVPGSFDSCCQLPLMLGTGAGYSSGENLALFGKILPQFH
jgi:hypothetical protein